MIEMRKHPRFDCTIKVAFEYFTGNPEAAGGDNVKLDRSGKGTAFNISQGGLLIVSDERVPVSVPVSVEFKIKKNSYKARGIIVRAGIIVNNPTPVAKKLQAYTSHGAAFFAIQFDTPIDFTPAEL